MQYHRDEINTRPFFSRFSLNDFIKNDQFIHFIEFDVSNN